MDNIWVILAEVGLTGALSAAVIGFFVRRIEKRIEREQAERARREQERREFEMFQVRGLTATIKLCKANAIALKNGKCNGETSAAMEYLQAVETEQREFLYKQGVNNLF